MAARCGITSTSPCWPASTIPDLNEMGSVCALRHRIPLVTLYPGDEFGPGASTEFAALLLDREVEAAYVAAFAAARPHRR